MKGDIFILYTLCLLFNKHAIIHLGKGYAWTTLNQLSNNQYTDLAKCDLHLCYVGRGLFVELIKRDSPLEISSDTDERQSLIIGELTVTEEKTLQSIEMTGLGVAVDKCPMTTLNPSTLTSTIVATLPTLQVSHTSYPFIKQATIKLVKLNIMPGVTVQITDGAISSVSTSKNAAYTGDIIDYWQPNLEGNTQTQAVERHSKPVVVKKQKE